MEDNDKTKNIEEEKIEETTENHHWEQTFRLPAFDNILPVVKSMITLIEGEKQKTLNQIEETKKLLEKIKENQRK
jgi:hypothetical protein